MQRVTLNILITSRVAYNGQFEHLKSLNAHVTPLVR